MAGSSPAMTTVLIGEPGAPPQRPQTPLLHRRRARFRFPDPESPLRHVLRQGRSRPARRRRDRRLRARSLATRAGLPLRCRRAGRVRRVAAQSIHGAGTKGVVEHACADQRAIAARPSRTARQRETAPARAGADGGREAASAVRGLRLHRFLFVEGARHQCRRDVPRQGQCAAAELAAHADRLQRPRLHRRRQRHAGDAGRAGS